MQCFIANKIMVNLAIETVKEYLLQCHYLSGEGKFKLQAPTAHLLEWLKLRINK